MHGVDYNELDNLDLELSQQEKEDLKEIDNLLKNNAGENLSSKVWGTIKQAAIDSVEQMIGLDDRGDWRPNKGAVVTTPLNFRQGVVATENDRKRFEMWQERVHGTKESATEFRERVIKPDFDRAGTGVRDTFKKSIKRPDGSYENAYNGKTLHEQNDPRAYDQPDSSGDMKRDTKKTVNIDHVNAVGDIYKDDKVALYSSCDQAGVEQDIKTIVNNPNNLAATDEHGNKSIQDKDTLEQAKNNPDLEWDPERVRECQDRADKAKNMQLLKNAWQEKGKDLAVGVGKSTLAATGKMLVGESIKIVVSETYLEFTRNSSDESLMERAKRLIQKIMERAKRELSNLWHKVAQFAASNALSEIVNLIVNYFFSTVKNIFKLIRCMIGSIIKAVKIILDPSRPWQERLFEALKVVSAGIALASGTLLNELLDKAISTNIPFLAPVSGDISAVISGLVSSILSALVLMAFDSVKEELFADSPYKQLSLMKTRIVSIDSARLSLSTLRTDMMMRDTYEFVGNAFDYMAEKRADIIEQQCEAKRLDGAIDDEIDKQKERNNNIKDISNKFLDDDEF